MKKLVSLLIISLLLTSMSFTAFASNYNEDAMAYLKEKHGVLEDRIIFYDGGIFELEFTKESFWSGSYTILPEGITADEYLRSLKMEPLPMPLPAPAEDTYTTPLPADRPADSGEIHPVAPIDEGFIYGGIYIHVKTGKILDSQEMEAYFTAEWKIAEKEWERLRKEAGKLDVSLYRKLQEISKTEAVKVWLQPMAEITDEVRQQFEALKEKYPEITKDMELSDYIGYGFGFSLPYDGGIGAGSSSASVARDLPAGDIAVSDPATSYIAPSKDEPEFRILPVFDDEYWQVYDAMWRELEEIRLLAIKPALANISSTLDNKGIKYENNGAAIVVELTKDQINEIAELPTISMVYEEVSFIALDSVGNAELMLRTTGAVEAFATTQAAPVEKAANYLLPLLVAMLAIATGYLIFKRKTMSNEQ